MNLEYKCKVCEKTGTAKSDDETPQSWIKALTPLLTCNRCFDYYSAKRSSFERVRHWALRLNTARLIHHPKLEAIEELSRGKFADLTRKFATLVCLHHGHRFCWEPDFIEQCMEHPTKTQFIMTKYEHSIATGKWNR